MSVPSHLQSRLWSKATGKLDVKEDQDYIIAQLLQYGTLGDLAWLRDQYPLSEIVRVYHRLKKQPLHPSITHFLDRWLEKKHEA